MSASTNAVVTLLILLAALVTLPYVAPAITALPNVWLQAWALGGYFLTLVMCVLALVNWTRR